MRLQTTVTDLDPIRWGYLQRMVQAEYEIPEDATRVCLTFTYGEQERHVEMPMGTLVSLLIGLGMVHLGKNLDEAFRAMSDSLKDLRTNKDGER